MYTRRHDPHKAHVFDRGHDGVVYQEPECGVEGGGKLD